MKNMYRITDLTTGRLVAFVIAKSYRAAQVYAAVHRYGRFNSVTSFNQ